MAVSQGRSFRDLRTYSTGRCASGDSGEGVETLSTRRGDSGEALQDRPKRAHGTHHGARCAAHGSKFEPPGLLPGCRNMAEPETSERKRVCSVPREEAPPAHTTAAVGSTEAVQAPPPAEAEVGHHAASAAAAKRSVRVRSQCLSTLVDHHQRAEADIRPDDADGND